MEKSIDKLIEENFPLGADRCKEVVKLVIHQLSRAVKKHPAFPTDIVHIAAVVTEEAGEVAKAANHCYESNESIFNVEGELQHTAATCLRAMLAIHGRQYKVIDTR